EVLPGDSGRTLPAVLHDRGGFTHSEAKGLIDAGAVRGPLEGTQQHGSRATRRTPVLRPGEDARRVVTGERYEVRLDPGRRYRPKPGPRPGTGYKVVHDDRDLLVVEKEPRLLSVPTPLRQDEDSLVERLLESERERGVR